jgi:hypothetical protein
MNPNHLYLLNPHRDDFIWEPLYFKYIKRRALKKYNYIADVFTEKQNVKLLVYDKCSGLFPQSVMNVLPTKARRAILKWEMKRWLAINNLSSDTEFTWLDKDLNAKENDEVFMFQLSNEKYIAEANTLLQNFKNVYVHLSHYYLDPKRISKTFSALSNVVFCGDSDVSAHPFFVKYFPWYTKNFKIVLFYIADRFKPTIPFVQKINKIISTGTFHHIADFPNSTYLSKDLAVDSFHYNRKNIFDNKAIMQSTITCYNSPWKQKDAAWYTKLWDAAKVSQKSYFQIDIVEQYNQHRYALVGEEICGFPGIGTFEAMACGCAAYINPNSIAGLVTDTDCYIAETARITTDFQFKKLDDTALDILSVKANLFVENNLRKTKCATLFIKNFLPA